MIVEKQSVKTKQFEHHTSTARTHQRYALWSRTQV